MNGTGVKQKSYYVYDSRLPRDLVIDTNTSNEKQRKLWFNNLTETQQIRSTLEYSNALEKILDDLIHSPFFKTQESIANKKQFEYDSKFSEKYQQENKPSQQRNINSDTNTELERAKEEFMDFDRKPQRSITEFLKNSFNKIQTKEMDTVIPDNAFPEIKFISKSLKAISGGDYRNFAKLGKKYLDYYKSTLENKPSQENHEKLRQLTIVLKQNLLNLEEHRQEPR